MIKKKKKVTEDEGPVNYNKSKMAKIRKHFQETGGSSDARWFSIKAPERGQDAKATIRVLPPWGKSADGFFYYTVGQHFGFSIGGRNRSISCPESIGKGKCPVCVFQSRLKNSENPDHTKLADRIRPNRRYFVNVIDREDTEAQVRMYGTNKKFVETILDSSDDPDIGDMTDPRRGRDITIIRKGSGLRTRYSYRVRTKRSPVEFEIKDLYQLDKEVDEWLSYDAMVECIKSNFAEELKELGLKFGKAKKSEPIEDDDNEEEEDEKPKKKLKLVKKKKKVVEPEEDEEEDDDIDDEDDNDDNDDDDDDVEDDEEDEED